MSRKVFVSLALVPAIAMLCGCGRNPLFFRLAANYYPVSPVGTQWDYELSGGGSLIVTVVDQTVKSQRGCYKIQRGTDYAYFVNEAGRLDHYEDHRVMFNGYEVPVYQSWVTYLEWPLTMGYCRTDTASASTTVQGVTITHNWRRTVEVMGLETVSDSTGTWESCYHLRQAERTIDWIQTGGYEPETTYVTRNIWLAPDVGMVKKTTPDSTLVLSGYSPGQ
ncbi:hypothetical protein GF402_00535 [Candidatus Fermentibacteria bacterium]|nr:hypothetical protein [Candidatus Fermentibacteria bacterium]